MQKKIILSTSISIFSILIIGGMLYFFPKDAAIRSDRSGAAQSQNSEIRDGVQYVTIVAKGGYFPQTSSVKSGIPTKLVVKTNGTFDCSASLVIRSIGFQKILAPTGEEVIDLGMPNAGEKIQGICGMGMYNFQITFN